MAKAGALIVSTLCALAIAGLANWHQDASAPTPGEPFVVIEKVYCDPCHIQFETRLSRPLENALVELTCTCLESGSLTYSTNATTDVNGQYSLKVEWDHKNDTCEVELKKSEDSECSKPFDENEKARVSCTSNTSSSTFTTTNHLRTKRVGWVVLNKV